jgi:hypothetical protein
MQTKILDHMKLRLAQQAACLGVDIAQAIIDNDGVLFGKAV